MKKAFYTTPVTNVMKVETTGNILESSNRLGTGDRNNVGMQRLYSQAASFPSRGKRCGFLPLP